MWGGLTPLVKCWPHHLICTNRYECEGTQERGYNKGLKRRAIKMVLNWNERGKEEGIAKVSAQILSTNSELCRKLFIIKTADLLHLQKVRYLVRIWNVRNTFLLSIKYYCYIKHKTLCIVSIWLLVLVVFLKSHVPKSMCEFHDFCKQIKNT